MLVRDFAILFVVMLLFYPLSNAAAKSLPCSRIRSYTLQITVREARLILHKRRVHKEARSAPHAATSGCKATMYLHKSGTCLLRRPVAISGRHAALAAAVAEGQRKALLQRRRRTLRTSRANRAGRRGRRQRRGDRIGGPMHRRPIANEHR